MFNRGRRHEKHAHTLVLTVALKSVMYIKGNEENSK